MMKYFTPQLYQRFNSFDPREAELADEAWDKAEAEYNERLAALRDRMTSQVEKLSRICLHDAEVLCREEVTQPLAPLPYFNGPHPIPFWSAVAFISVKLDQEIVSLVYCLSDHVRATPAPEGWRFSKLQEQWLYDEVDLLSDRNGPFVHRILFSTGVTLEIPFLSVIIQRFALPTLASGKVKQTA